MLSGLIILLASEVHAIKRLLLFDYSDVSKNF